MPAAPPELHGLRILVVEDEFLVALELEGMLHELGGEVIGPLGGLEQAVAVAQQETLDAAVLDVNVGGRAVTPVADALAARAIPFVFCTGYDAASLPAPHAAVPIIMKPCQAHQLKHAVLTSLRAGRAHAAGAARRTERKARATTGADRARRAGRRPGD